MIAWSKNEPRLTAAKMPAGMPSTTAKMMAQSDSSSVAGKSCEELRRGPARLVTIEVPKSPVQHAAEIVEILDDHRPVEAELVR